MCSNAYNSKVEDGIHFCFAKNARKLLLDDKTRKWGGNSSTQPSSNTQVTFTAHPIITMHSKIKFIEVDLFHKYEFKAKKRRGREGKRNESGTLMRNERINRTFWSVACCLYPSIAFPSCEAQSTRAFLPIALIGIIIVPEV